jgi:hypothetical protein
MPDQDLLATCWTTAGGCGTAAGRRRALRAAGWAGPWGVEILSETFRRLPVGEAVAAAFATARAQLELADDGR